MSGIERVEMEAAYVLHHRPYRESSQLLEVLAREHGRVGLVARGARGARPRWRGSLQPFQPLHLSWAGRGGLCTLSAAEPAGPPPGGLRGDRLLSAYYLNELVLAFTTRGDPHPELFAHYSAGLAALAGSSSTEIPLRRFELALLNEVGYGLSVVTDARNGALLDPEQRYDYVVDRGAVPVCAGHDGPAWTGRQLAAIAAGDFARVDDLALAKQLLRRVLAHHLGGRPLRTREVFAAMHR